jgi:hypothetical protein
MSLMRLKPLSPSFWRTMLLLGVVQVSLTACATVTPTVVTVVKSDAEAFKHIRYSKNDTTDTQRQARRHNALLDALRKKQKAERPQS